MKKILFISNGFSEDLVAITLIKELRKVHQLLEIYCLPIVGNARHFKPIKVKVIGPHWETPSEGLNYGNWALTFFDILFGLPLLILGQLISLFLLRKKFDLVITVGDYVGVASAAIARISAPLFHVWVCPAGYYPKFVKKYISEHAVAVYQRGPGASSLDDTGVKVQFVGNPLLDTFEITGEDFGLKGNRPTIGVLPGSRKVVYKNLRLLLEVLSGILKRKKVNVLVSLSPKMDRKKFMTSAKKYPGWSDEYVISEKFGDILNRSDLIIGLARTGNEQALGMGKPVVTFWGKGFSMSERMVRGHAHRILKKVPVLLPPDPERISSKVVSLLDDPAEMKDLGRKGIELMGPRGASRTIAREIKAFLEAGEKKT